MTVSVAIETYNGAKYIKEQIESILSQTIIPNQIIIRDDNSTDETVSILNTYKNKYPEIIQIIVDGKRLGCDLGFIECFRYAVGDIIFSCDQDDIWIENKIEKILSLFDDETDLVYAQDYEYIDETGESTYSKVSIPSLNKTMYYCFLKGHTAAFRKAIIQIFDFKGLITWDYYLQMYSIVSGRYKETPDALMYWRRHLGSQTYSLNNKQVKKEGKWQVCYQAIKKIQSGFFSECINQRYSARSKYLIFLSQNKLVDPKRQKDVFLCIKILSLISKQTIGSLLWASILNVISSKTDIRNNASSFRQRIGAVLFSLRYPLTYWYHASDAKYL